MAFKIDSNDFSDFIVTVEDNTFTKPTIELEDVKSVKYTTPKGDIFFNEQLVNDHLSIFQGKYQLEDDVTIAGKGETSLLELHFNLSNQKIGFISPGNSKEFTPSMSGNITYLTAEDNHAKIDFRKNIEYNTFDIHLPLSLLTKYAGESSVMDNFLNAIEHNISSALALEEIKVTAKIYAVMQDINSCVYKGLTRKIYIESKIYELIALCHHHLETETEIHSLSRNDIEKIHFAAQLIRENIDNPFTILELSRQVGINQTKLKDGFKMIFGETVFGYLQEIRMTKAKNYLLNTALPIQEISVLSGYQSVSNFSIAFKRIFGYSPTQLRLKI